MVLGHETYIRMKKNIRLLYFLSGMIGLSRFSGKAIVKTNLQSPLLIIYFPSVSLVRATSLLFSHIEKLNYFSSPLLTTKLKSKSRKFTNSKRNCNVLFESQIKWLMLYLYLSNIIVISSIVFYFIMIERKYLYLFKLLVKYFAQHEIIILEIFLLCMLYSI